LSRVNAEMHDLLDLLPGSSLDPVWFLVLVTWDGGDKNWEHNIRIEVIIVLLYKSLPLYMSKNMVFEPFLITIENW
jgi:hypothetical protein